MKNIKDYLHLYLGCEVSWIANEVGTLVGISKSEVEPDRTIAIIGGAVFQEWYVEEVKPILRSLSAMTEVEAIEMTKIKHGIYTGDTAFWSNEFGGEWHVGLKHASTHYAPNRIGKVNSPEEFLYLLSKGFDLFGLIESGLAIEVKNQQEKI